MTGRTYSAPGTGKYRYGFNGKEEDNEVKGSGNTIAYELRIYDARLGRFSSIDPRTKEYAWQSPYAYFSNRPISTLDYLGGGEIWDDQSHENSGKIESQDANSGNKTMAPDPKNERQQKWWDFRFKVANIFGKDHIKVKAFDKTTGISKKTKYYGPDSKATFSTSGTGPTSRVGDFSGGANLAMIIDETNYPGGIPAAPGIPGVSGPAANFTTTFTIPGRAGQVKILRLSMMTNMVTGTGAMDGIPNVLTLTRISPTPGPVWSSGGGPPPGVPILVNSLIMNFNVRAQQVYQITIGPAPAATGSMNDLFNVLISTQNP